MPLVHYHRPKATLDQMARPPEPSIDRPGVAPGASPKIARDPSASVGGTPSGHDRQVDVIGHQAIVPDCCAGAPRCRGDQSPIEALVVGLEKHEFAPITALGDIVGASPARHARDPRHARTPFGRAAKCSLR